MKKKVFLQFKKGKQRLLLIDAIKKAGSERNLINLIKMPSASIYDYKNEIRPIPKERARSLAKFLNLDFNKIIKETEKKVIKQWDKRETDFLLKNYQDMTAKEIAKRLNKTINSIKHKRRKLRLEKGHAYRWNREKIIIYFNKFKKKIGRTPSYKDCSNEASGMLSAIERIWGKYSNFLYELGLNIRIKKWDKQKCIMEFEKIRKKIKKTPTQKQLNKCSGLFKAIIKRWKTYNNFLRKLGYTPNFEFKWNQKECIIEFNKIMLNRTRLPTIEEMIKINPALIAAIYKYFDSYSSFLRILNYEINDDWQKWERLVTKICKRLYPNTIVKPRLENNKQPDIVIKKKELFDKIIDAKLNSFANSINKDIINYMPYCKKLEFWCLIGNKNLNRKNIKIMGFTQIKQLLEKNKEKELIKELKAMIKK